MSDILVTSPYRPFTLPNQFKAVFNGFIYCGTVDAVDPSNSQVQVYVANEDGSRTPVSQPLRTNAGGLLVYNGQPAKFVTDSNHSILVRDSLGAQIWYAPNMAIADPESLSTILAGSGGADYVGSTNGTVQEDIDSLHLGQDYQKFFSVPEEFPDLIGINNSPAIQAAINSTEKSTLLRKLYDVSTQVNAASKKSITGQGNDTGLKWTGGNGVAGQSVLRIAATDPAINALNGVTVKDFVVDMQGAQNLTGVDMLYASVQSMLDGVQVTQMGDGSIGFRVGKEWYARLERCSVRNNARVGTAVYVDTAVGQVNSFPLDVQINGADIGFGLDTSGNYIYNLDLPSTAHAENCNVGLRVWPGQGVRSGVIRAYFENNDIDVWWGSSGAAPADITQTILWLGTSFNPNGSLVRLYEGNHIFDGCDRINTLEVHERATVEIRGSIVNNIINTTGDPNAVRYRPTAKTVLSTSNYGNTALLPGREINDVQIGSATTAVFNIISRLFGVTNPSAGRSARCVATSRRSYENTVKFLEFVITQSSSGTWGYTLTGGVADGMWSVAINSSTGVITITDTRGDTKVYTLTASPM